MKVTAGILYAGAASLYLLTAVILLLFIVFFTCQGPFKCKVQFHLHVI